MNKVAVIGLGSIATRHRNNLKRLFPDSILYAMSASGRIPNEEISDCDTLVENLEELINHKPEMVIVASPAPYHCSHAIPLINAAIPTLIEKPVAAHMDDVELLIDATNKNSTPVLVGYCLRYLPSAQKIKTLLEQKVIGDIYNTFIQVGQYLPSWRKDKDYRNSVSAQKKLGGGALLELSHELDYAQWLLGDLEHEFSILRSTNELSLDVEDIADILLTTKRGGVCNIHLDFLQRTPQRTCSLIGSQGRLDCDLIANRITLCTGKGVKEIYSEPEWDKNLMYVSMIQDFKKIIDEGSYSKSIISQSTNIVKLIECIKHNAKWSN